ncbi:MAG TPA: helix-turn-helix transcriptional regulator [Actinomycetota bacterium]
MRKARLRQGLTQSELAGDEYSAAYVSIIEAGKREPSEKVLRTFAEKLGLTFEELALGRPPDAEADLEQELVSARRALFAGDAEDAMSAFRRIGRRADQFGLERVAERAALGAALGLERTGQFEDAAGAYEQLQVSLPDEHTEAKADAVAGRARCISMLGDVAYATYLLEGFLSHLERSRLQDPDALLRIHMSLVALYFQGGLTVQAGEAADVALSMSARARDQEKVAGMHINVARVLMDRGKYAAAARSFRSAEKIYSNLGYEAELGMTYLARAFLMKEQKRFADARSDLERALEIFEAADDAVNQSRALRQLAVLERIAGHVEQAVFLLQRAARVTTTQPAVATAITNRELGLCHAAMKDLGKARTYFNKAIGLLEKTGDTHELAVTYRALGDALRDEKDYRKACDAYRLAAVALEAA